VVSRLRLRTQPAFELFLLGAQVRDAEKPSRVQLSPYGKPVPLGRRKRHAVPSSVLTHELPSLDPPRSDHARLPFRCKRLKPSA
jgi:hypothetical protein